MDMRCSAFDCVFLDYLQRGEISMVNGDVFNVVTQREDRYLDFTPDSLYTTF
jgi:hypothetical protein